MLILPQNCNKLKRCSKEVIQYKMRTFKISSKDDKVIIFLSILLLNGKKLFFFSLGVINAKWNMYFAKNFEALLFIQRRLRFITYYFWACWDVNNSSFMMTSQCCQNLHLKSEQRCYSDKRSGMGGNISYIF